MKLSTGKPSTLGSYYDHCCAVFGSKSKPALYFADKIRSAPTGRDEEVLADESQMMFLIASLTRRQR